MLRKVNHGTKTSVVLDDQKRFKYLSVALGACIEGFQAMRKVIIVDATFLKTKYGGALVFATAQDPAHYHYPIAFAVIDGEKEDSWTWFFNTLKTIIPDSEELVFISDRNVNLLKAVSVVYPSCEHGHCIYHLSQNVKKKVATWQRDEVAAKFREIAVIYTVAEFEVQYQNFRMRYPKAAAYLDEFVEVKKWAKCYFPRLKYNIDTSNAVESMNDNGLTNIGKKLLLVPFVENLIHKRCEVACKLPVTELNTFQLEYNVIGRDGKTYVVDLRNKGCSCRYFDLDKYPCVHAIPAAMNLLKQDGRTTEDDLSSAA
ncbi:PREDICTED: uncharacterized protein LOC104728577 [Camelina sativa]|uniref:Uncharacterized protein LOC104728577 n=1 Tax=Camelina sativa TaxID=90675 RepID=A0ABM0UT07_CAMSA|nr:PREDICTED: uncharacterized protein LOC104728577 [Camelina sativa]